MKAVGWNPEKNAWLWLNRGVGFELVEIKLAREDVLDLIEHPSPRYAHQRICVVEIGGYAYLVPVVETSTEIFLKTMIPSRKATKRYLGGGSTQ